MLTVAWLCACTHMLLQIESFQGEPQLLDAELKHLIPPIVEAFLLHIQNESPSTSRGTVDLQTALSIIIYTLCKVRGRKVIVRFFNNEPRYLELVLTYLETRSSDTLNWRTHYVLLLWLSHLLLTPFDLASISTDARAARTDDGLSLGQGVPAVATRVALLGTKFLSTSTLAQEAAASMLVRLAIRPDMQKLRVGDVLVDHSLAKLSPGVEGLQHDLYPQLGSLRFLAGLATSADLEHLIPRIYRTCEALVSSDDSGNPLAANAVGKKLMLKAYRNVAVLCVRSASVSGPLQSFVEMSNVLENVVDFLLLSLGDRETPVRCAAAKAMSMIVLELNPGMGHEVIQAVLDNFKEDTVRHAGADDFRTANPLRWHGLTLALAYALFKRSAAPEQMADILCALLSALNFEQRTATGSSIGTNVRDAANFGIWSLSRRYTTKELLKVDANTINLGRGSVNADSVIQALAGQLLQSACLDPVGNIRRGSSAALQELIGRHPNVVHNGIALVQVVDYQAVGLRKRAMVDVARQAAVLHLTYWEELVEGLNRWRGLGSTDVLSREAAAISLAQLATDGRSASRSLVTERLRASLKSSPQTDIEELHGLVLALAATAESAQFGPNDQAAHSRLVEDYRRSWIALREAGTLDLDFNPRILRAELPVAVARLATVICQMERTPQSASGPTPLFPDRLETFVDRLLNRQEDAVLSVIPKLTSELSKLQRTVGTSCPSLGVAILSKRLSSESHRPTLYGAGRAFALGALASQFDPRLQAPERQTVIDALVDLSSSPHVDWRIIGLRTIELVLQDIKTNQTGEQKVDLAMLDAVHRGLNDFTIDERGDIGSLVRLQGIACVDTMTGILSFAQDEERSQTLQADILRLALEKLDRVRLQAARCRRRFGDNPRALEPVVDVGSEAYLSEVLAPAWTPATPGWMRRALIEGLISCAGLAGEHLLQISRKVLADNLVLLPTEQLHDVMNLLAMIMKDTLTDNASLHPALELLAFLLSMQSLQRLADTDFRWRSLLSTVQKAHHKSTDMPKILSAVRVYVGLAEVQSIHDEVLKKLVNMLKTNPYPNVRASVADALFIITREETLKSRNWSRPVSHNAGALATVQRRCIAT